MTEQADPKEPEIKEAPFALLFDVDGVLTDAKLKPNEDLIRKIGSFVDAGIPVAFLTGRSDEFLVKSILPVLKSSVSDKKMLDNVYAVAEFGAINIRFENGEEKIEVNNGLSLPQAARDEAQEISAGFLDSMWIEPKRTMFTIVQKDTTPDEDFKNQQRVLTLKLQELLAKARIDRNFEAHPDEHATNIRPKTSNKRYATGVVLEHFESLGLKPARFYSFGDSKSDLEIKQELDSRGLANIHVFVGSRAPFENKDANIVLPQKTNDLGTFEFLDGLNTTR